MGAVAKRGRVSLINKTTNAGQVLHLYQGQQTSVAPHPLWHLSCLWKYSSAEPAISNKNTAGRVEDARSPGSLQASRTNASSFRGVGVHTDSPPFAGEHLPPFMFAMPHVVTPRIFCPEAGGNRLCSRHTSHLRPIRGKLPVHKPGGVNSEISKHRIGWIKYGSRLLLHFFTFNI